jgi:hypothetical protein
MHLTPIKRHALKVVVAAQTPRLVKCRGGFRPATGPGAASEIINLRTIRALEADQLIRLDDEQFPSEANLTPRGLDAAREIYADTPKAERVEHLAKAVLQ